MQALSIFLSSTCYDLRSLREHLKTEITSWGHDPVLSEYPSFPVSPDLSTVENCKRVIRGRADVLVLVVGGRRGSLDPTSQRSVVNSEYREARAGGLDCIVFVERPVWDLLPLFRKNPDTDFTPTVDYPDVFRFVEEIQKDTKWIFPFGHTDEIIATLRAQLSIRFRDLLQRYRTNRLLIPPEFASESADIARIAVDRDRLWEYRLACELLRDRIRRLDAKFSDLKAGYVVRRTRFLAGRDTLNYSQDLLRDFINIIGAVAKALEEQLTSAFGPPGVAGDALQIKRACDNLYSLFLSLYEWELDVRFVRPHEALAWVFSGMQGWASELLGEFRRTQVQLDTLLADPELAGEHTIVLAIKAPAGLNGLMSELERKSRDPLVLAALADG